MREKIETVLFSEAQIAERVAQLGTQIAEDYRDKGNLLLIGVLRGGRSSSAT